MRHWFLSFLIFIQVLGFSQGNENDISIDLKDLKLCITPLNDNAVRIRSIKNFNQITPEIILTQEYNCQNFNTIESDSIVKIILPQIIIVYSKNTECLSFYTTSGKIFLSEAQGKRKLNPFTAEGESYYVAEQSFESPEDEYIFGLGQFQDGHFNLKNITRRLIQVNSQIALPFIYSSKGYGLLWHQYGLTDFNPADQLILLEKIKESEKIEIAEVTTTAGTQKIAQDQSLYRGKFNVPNDGKYCLFLDLGDMGNKYFLAIDGKPYIDFSNFWLPPSTSTIVDLKTGEHNVEVICKSSNTPKVYWRRIENKITFRSPHARMIDYIVFYGPSADSIIKSYRSLTGNVPLLPLWAYGFWQCRERYTSFIHLLETVKEFRRRNLPVDVIVQDWQYWGNNGWGVPILDENNYPNPSGFIKELHDLNTKFCISIWSNPDKNSSIGKEYSERGEYIPGTSWLDYFNHQTRLNYWNTLKENLFQHGVDAWWMDATEPENDALKGTKTFIGPGDFYRLTYPLFVSQAVYEGQRGVTSDKRVCILTRSAFLGQQRYGTINWSGDVNGTWESYRIQIVAGLNYSITGLPYWTTDIGGFFRPGQKQYTDEKYHELLIRWFQWGAFNPIFRVHGYMSETEPWKYGQKIENIIRKILNLRYALIPYLYSEAWQMTANGSTIMRPLIMDFPNDLTALSQPFEYMFGKIFLVCPVVHPDINEMKVYLPGTTDWYDFWTGEKHNGGEHIIKETPIDIIPLFIKAGSILPVGPKVQYTTEKKWDELEIRIYPGANGEFILYEDEGDSYNYVKGMYSLIKFSWNDKKNELTIHERQGSFSGMLIHRKFRIVKVAKNKGIGYEVSTGWDKEIIYNGKETKVKLK